MAIMKSWAFYPVVFLCLTVVKSAYAVTSWNKFLPQPLAKSDGLLMKEKARAELTDKQPGTTLTWDNPETQLKGTVTLNRMFIINKYECRDITHLVTFPNKQLIQFNGTLCQIDKENDRWELLPFTFQNDDANFNDTNREFIP